MSNGCYHSILEVPEPAYGQSLLSLMEDIEASRNTCSFYAVDPSGSKLTDYRNHPFRVMSRAFFRSNEKATALTPA